MNFTVKNLDKWKRKEYFEHYFTNVPCTYSLTANIDISGIKAVGFKLYPTILYLLTSIVNMHEEFRTSIDAEGNVGVFDEMHPSYTIFHKETETFSNLWTEYDVDYKVFCGRFATDMKNYGTIERFIAKPEAPANTFPVSMIPWTTFTGFNLNLGEGYKYLLPIFTLGKYYNESDKILIPISIQVHHSVCDGYHVSLFINELQECINTICK